MGVSRVCQFPRKMNKVLRYSHFRVLFCFSNCKDLAYDFWEKRAPLVLRWCLRYRSRQEMAIDIIFFQSRSQCLPLPYDIPARRSLTCLKTSAQNILLHTYICMDMNITFILHLLPLPLTLTLYLSSGNTFQMYPILLRSPLYQRQSHFAS